MSITVCNLMSFKEMQLQQFHEESEKNRGRFNHCNIHSVLMTEEGNAISYNPFSLFGAIHEL